MTELSALELEQDHEPIPQGSTILPDERQAWLSSWETAATLESQYEYRPDSTDAMWDTFGGFDD